MSQLYVNALYQHLCEKCSKDQICHIVKTLNAGEFYNCDQCGARVERRGQRRKKSLIDLSTWKPESTEKRRIINMDAGEHIYIVNKHQAVRIFTVGDDNFQSTDIHFVSSTEFLGKKILHFTEDGIKSLSTAKTKFLCFSTQGEKNDNASN